MEPYTSFAVKRIVAGIIIAAAILVAAFIGIKLHDKWQSSREAPVTPTATSVSASTAEPAEKQAKPAKPVGETEKRETAEAGKPPEKTPPAEPAKAPTSKPKGVLFVQAVIRPMAYELNERFWRWRPNDILDFTDNVNRFQLGVLEVTRRTSMILTERLSRTGSTASFDPNLERAMNWFMIKADRYWFPSAESKYREALDELARYSEKLEKGKATFYTRPDNLIPLLAAYKDLLGSCDENLVKDREDDGSDVSFFEADDYFYYAQGVASAMGTILEAVLQDFRETLESRHGIEPLRLAIESCRLATRISPWIITDADLGSMIANHRANMAAPISHARFYIGVLILTLST
jgi:hypothetical protein